MKFKILILIFVSVIIRGCLLLILDLDIEDYNNGFFNIIGLTYSDLLEYCVLKESGIDYFIAKDVDFPVLFLSMFSSSCEQIVSGNKILIFSIITSIEIMQGLLIYDYLYRNYSFISKISKSHFDLESYKTCILIFLMLYWLNPISIYTNILLSLGVHLELLFLLTLIWTSNSTIKLVRICLPLFYGLLVYVTPNAFISLFPCLLYFYQIENYDLSIFDYKYQSENFKQQISKFKESIFQNVISKKNFLISLKFIFSFLIVYSMLHSISYNLISEINFNEYCKRFILNNFSFEKNRDLTPYMNIHWFLMSTIIPKFKFFFQLILSSLLILHSINIVIVIGIPIKSLLAQVFLISIFKSNPTLLNYILVILLIMFDHFTLFNSQLSILSSISFIIWIISFSCSFFLRSVWILEDRLNSNTYYFMILASQFSILIFIGEWMKQIFNVRKESIINSTEKQKIE